MKVLLLNYEFPPAGGGAGFATFNIAKQLVKLGIEVHVLTSFIEGEPETQTLHGITVHRVPSWRKGIHDCGMLGAYSYVAFASIKRWRLHRDHKFDLEHFFFSMPTGALTLLPPQFKKSKYIVSLRGSDVPGYDPFNTQLEKFHKLLKPITKRIWRSAESVVALSNGLKVIAEETDQSIPIKVIPNGIEESSFIPATPQEAENTTRPIKLITVSRLLERKGIHHLLQAIDHPELQTLELDIIGTGQYETELKHLADKLGLNHRVHFKGFVNRNELPKYYQESDIFVLPSMTESFGLVFAEAMSCGLPIIGGRVGGVPELVRHGTDGLLVEAGSTTSITDALLEMTKDRSSLAAMGQNSRQRILEKFTWSAVARQYLATYNEALNKEVD